MDAFGNQKIDQNSYIKNGTNKKRDLQNDSVLSFGAFGPIDQQRSRYNSHKGFNPQSQKNSKIGYDNMSNGKPS